MRHKNKYFNQNDPTEKINRILACHQPSFTTNQKLFLIFFVYIEQIKAQQDRLILTLLQIVLWCIPACHPSNYKCILRHRWIPFDKAIFMERNEKFCYSTRISHKNVACMIKDTHLHSYKIFSLFSPAYVVILTKHLFVMT